MLKSAPVLAAILIVVSLPGTAPAQMSLDDDGTRLRVLDRERPILGYYYGSTGSDQAPRDKLFIYPLHGLAGEGIVAESEELDGHSGLFWGWGNCEVGDRPMDIWAGTSARRVFERWLERSASADRADIALQSVWIFTDSGEAQVLETTYITIWPEMRTSRSIDISIYLRNISFEMLTIAGVDHAQGFCLRLAPQLKNLSISGAKGIMDEGLRSMRSPWLDISYRNPRHSSYSGLTIFQHPKNPGFSGQNWYSGTDGVIGAGIPASERFKLKPGQGLHFRYRLYFHRGYGPDQALDKPYAAYLLEVNAENSR